MLRCSILLYVCDRHKCVSYHSKSCLTTRFGRYHGPKMKDEKVLQLMKTDPVLMDIIRKQKINLFEHFMREPIYHFL